MKIVLSTHEVTNFFSQLANGEKIIALEAELASVRLDLESANASRRDAWARHERLESEVYELRRLHGDAQREISRLQDLLTPNRVERAYSLCFQRMLAGQKIQSIKEVRALLSIGLKEAKDVVEGAFTDTNYPNLMTLSQIFANLHQNSLVADGQRARMATLLSEKHSDENLDLILSGTFHSKYA